MKSIFVPLLTIWAATQASGHATFQDLWCARLPNSNSPVTDVSSNDLRCNVGGTTPAGSKCPVKAGDTVTVEMHQQNGDRSCSSDAIGGAHYGPLMVYLSKVDDASTADGSSGWFKIFEDSWAKSPSGAVGDDDFWGTKDMNTCCGRTNVKIPSDIPAGDYLLRAEVIALHVAGQKNGAQLYMTCFQITVSGGGNASPGTVKFPGAYSASDPGILIDIHAKVDAYEVPGPTVYSGGFIKSAGSGCSGCESTCTPGSAPSTTLPVTKPTNGSGGDGGDGCTVAAYGQCGGQGWTGCSKCASGLKCVDVSAPYYSQCQPA